MSKRISFTPAKNRILIRNEGRPLAVNVRFITVESEQDAETIARLLNAAQKAYNWLNNPNRGSEARQEQANSIAREIGEHLDKIAE